MSDKRKEWEDRIAEAISSLVETLIAGRVGASVYLLPTDDDRDEGYNVMEATRDKPIDMFFGELREAEEHCRVMKWHIVYKIWCSKCQVSRIFDNHPLGPAAIREFLKITHCDCGGKLQMRPPCL